MPENYSLELSPVDISPYKSGNTGIDYVTEFDSGRPGPHVMLSAVVHGNELCGAIALDFLLRNDLRPQHGRISLAFINTAAYHSFDPENPTASRFVDEDFNRCWGEDVLDGDRDSVETRRARELRPLIDSVDYLLDIHSMQQFCKPLMMCGPTQKGRELALAIATPIHIITDEGHIAGKRMRDYTPFIDPNSSRNALLIECGQHWEKSAAGVAIDATLRFLKHFDMIDHDYCQEQQLTLPEKCLQIEVTGPITIESDAFRFAEPFTGLEILADKGTLIGYDGDREIRTPYANCTLIMPTRRTQRGQTAVRLGRVVG